MQEADSKLLSRAEAATIREPLLLATFDLMGMRTPDGADGPKPIARAALEGQRSVFAGHEALFDYLLAARALYDENDPAAALASRCDRNGTPAVGSRPAPTAPARGPCG